MTGTPPQPSIRRLMLTGRVIVLVGAILTLVALLMPGVTRPAEALPDIKCIEYYFAYTDGHTDQGEECAETPQNNLTSGLHVTSLHISCSDRFATRVFDGETFVGWGASGGSNLMGHDVMHVIEDADGDPATTSDAQWGIKKSWTGNQGLDCGFTLGPPDPTPANPAAELAFSCADGLYVTATNDGDEDADLGIYQGATLLDTITVPKNTLTATRYLVEGENIAEDGSADFSVRFGTETLVDGQTVTKNCETPNVVVTPDPTPSVDVEKLVSLDGVTYQDADTGTGPTFTLGLGETQSAWFRVIISNTSGDGTTLLLGSLGDDVTGGDADAIDLSGCVFPEGGLPDGQSVVCNVGPVPTQTGIQHTNVVTVSATGAGQTVGDSDPANYLGEAQVGGVVTERPPAPGPAPQPPAPQPPAPQPPAEQPAPEVIAEELPRTGPEDLWLAGLALMLIGAGLLTLGRGKAMAATSYVGTTWTKNMP